MSKAPSPVETTLIGEPQHEPWLALLAIFCGYMLVGVIFTWPMALRWAEAPIQLGATPVDAGQNIWNLWWSWQSLSRGASPFFTRYLFYPETIALFWQTLGLSNALLVLPLIALAGPVAAFNSLILLSFGLGGLFTYLLCRRLALERPPALLGGLVFIVTPAHMPPILGGALEVAAIQWVPLLALLLMRALRRRSQFAPVVAGLALTATTLASHYYGLYGAVYVAAHTGLAVLLAHRQRLRLALALVGAVVLMTWVFTLLPFAGLAGAGGGGETPDWFGRQIFHSAALADLLPLNVRHPLWGEQAAALVAQLHPFGAELGLAPGLVVYLLMALALWRRWRASWPWLLLALLLLLLAMGPRLKLGTEATGIPLPYALLDLLGPFRNSTRPSRFVTLLLLPVALLAAHGAAVLRELLPRPGVIALAAALLAFELAVQPWPLLELRVAPIYKRLHNDPLPGAVLELPPGLNDSQYMLNQLCHGRPLAGGYLARTPDYPPINVDSAMRRLWSVRPATADIFPTEPAPELAALGIRYVTLNTTRLSNSELAILQAELAHPGISRYSVEEGLEVYAVDPAAARPLALPGAGWYAPEHEGSQRWRWMSDLARVRLLAPAPTTLALTLDATAYQQARPLTILLNGTPVYSTTIPAAPERRAIRLVLALPAGAGELLLQSEATVAPEGRALSLSIGPIGIEAALPATGPAAAPALTPAAGGLCSQ